MAKVCQYTEIGWVETACGHCGSDHMSALFAGYPAIYIVEADFELCDNHLHGLEDLIKYLDWDHMIDHAQLSLGFLYELAFAKLQI
jgi:leucyl aminopeptidase